MHKKYEITQNTIKFNDKKKTAKNTNFMQKILNSFFFYNFYTPYKLPKRPRTVLVAR